MVPSDSRRTVCSCLSRIVLFTHPTWFRVRLDRFHSQNCPRLEGKWYVYITMVCSLCSVFFVLQDSPSGITWHISPPSAWSSSLFYAGSTRSVKAADSITSQHPIEWDRKSLPVAYASAGVHCLSLVWFRSRGRCWNIHLGTRIHRWT